MPIDRASKDARTHWLVELLQFDARLAMGLSPRGRRMEVVTD